MLSLVAAALVWVGVHVGVAGSPLRPRIAGAIGEGGFRGIFSLLSVGAIAWLIAAWRAAPLVPLWTAPRALLWLSALLVLFACVLLVAALTTPNPGTIGGEAAAPGPPRGILRVTRHPGLWAFALWAAGHCLALGDAASLIFFGAFLATALAGMPSIDAKVARRNPAAWSALAPTTSILPGAAILGGRTRLRLGEIGIVIPLAGLALYAALVWLHPRLFGVPAWVG